MMMQRRTGMGDGFDTWNGVFYGLATVPTFLGNQIANYATGQPTAFNWGGAQASSPEESQTRAYMTLGIILVGGLIVFAMVAKK